MGTIQGDIIDAGDNIASPQAGLAGWTVGDNVGHINTPLSWQAIPGSDAGSNGLPADTQIGWFPSLHGCW